MNTAHVKCPRCHFRNPPDKQRCQRCLFNIHFRTVNVKYTPNWVQVSQDLTPDPRRMDANGETRAVDAMLETREKETSYSRKARLWEEARKKEWKANKPYVMKERGRKAAR